VTAVAGGGKWLVMSLRTNAAKTSAADVMKKLARNLGQGGGHRTKAGGAIKLESGSAAEVDRIREVLRRRYLRAVGVKSPRGSRLLPKPAGK
jgi:nanoRNase/pAp phosphatase (c-di-AMP/oligoRNAs hydrolase)